MTGIALLEPVGDLLRVVEAPRERRGGRAPGLVPGRSRPRAGGGARTPAGGCSCERSRADSGSVQSSNSSRRAAPVRQPPHVRALGVDPLELLVGEVAVLVPVLLLGDAEVDERPVPDVGEGHGCAGSLPRARGPSPPARRSLPPRRRPRSPGSFPSTARRARAPRPAPADAGTTAATPPGSAVAGGIVISPRTPGRARGTPPSSSGATPDFVASPERFTSHERGDRQPRRRRLASRASGRARRSRSRPSPSGSGGGR